LFFKLTSPVEKR